MSHDDVTDFMVAEAVTLKVHAEDKKAQEEAEREEEKKKWKKDNKHLKG